MKFSQCNLSFTFHLQKLIPFLNRESTVSKDNSSKDCLQYTSGQAPCQCLCQYSIIEVIKITERILRLHIPSLALSIKYHGQPRPWVTHPAVWIDELQCSGGSNEKT